MSATNDNFTEDKIISYQVLRVESFSKGSLAKIGGETERTSARHRNEDIDDTRTPLNYYFKHSDGGLLAQWNRTTKKLNATFRDAKNAHAFEGMIITSDEEFFKRQGYVKGEPPPDKTLCFFEECYRFALSEIGYRGTDENVLSAAVHFDEKTPHLQLYYIPLVDKAKKKVYAKDADGKVLRNKNGSPVQAKDEYEKSMFETTPLSSPKVCSSDFWAFKGGQLSFGDLQDRFYETVAAKYGLDRGEVGSNKKHTTKYQWQTAQQQRKLKDFQEYLDAFQNAIDGKTPFFKGELKKQIVGLTAEYKRLESEHEISLKDKEEIFARLLKMEKTLPELRKHEQFLLFLSRYAPDKLREAKSVAEERKNVASRPKSNHKSDYLSK